MSRLSRIVLSSLAVLLLGPSSRAQAPATPHAPDGGTRERLQSISILPKEGAPFRAVVVTEWTHLLADGSTSTVKNRRTVARDSSGRIFEERRFFTPDGDSEETRLSELDFSDPLRREIYICTPARRTCQVRPYTVPAAAPVAPEGPLPNNTGDVTRESLGERRISELDTVGSREITTLHASVMGNQREEPTVKEFWYSPRLEINLVVKRFDPRAGAQNFEVRSVDLSEPDPKLFVPPAGYTILHQVAER